jgi:hypothetical protein
LLYALNIAPTDDIVGWKLVTEKESPLVTGAIHLEMPAEVLWHIINIFRIYVKPDPRDRSGSSGYRFPFGVVTFEEFEKEQKIIANFELKIATVGNEAEEDIYPFPLHPYNQKGSDRLRFSGNDLVNDYFLAIGIGIS